MRIVIVSLACCFCCLSAEELELSKDTQEDVEKYESAVADIVSEAKSDLEAEDKKLVKALEKEFARMDRKIQTCSYKGS